MTLKAGKKHMWDVEYISTEAYLKRWGHIVMSASRYEKAEIDVFGMLSLTKIGQVTVTVMSPSSHTHHKHDISYFVKHLDYILSNWRCSGSCGDALADSVPDPDPDDGDNELETRSEIHTGMSFS
jgi:hypothetical protein